MTYLRFHLLFNLPALVLLLWLTRRRLRARHWRAIAMLCGIVLAATTPWDNWAVHCGIWDFDWARVTPVTIPLGGVRWRLPAEEYAFFLIETVLVALLTILCLPGRKMTNDNRNAAELGVAK
ncbi:MAG: lycopene cyclase domain-containing protein [Verrucomicrobia bacterium]|nr:lycopene cyclase domain-containing protein [Verrucomicrobiota bacterium]MBV9658675.1 lycopene cyclase domain-containing protein [Verrucomicrobiota bacterium]